MCAVSNIGTGWSRDIPERYPWVNPVPPIPPNQIPQGVTRQEFKELYKEVQELKLLLQAAKKFDEATGQKDCEMDEKVALIKQIAKLVGVDLGDVFESHKE